MGTGAGHERAASTRILPAFRWDGQVLGRVFSTLDKRPETLTALVDDVCSSLITHGFRKIILYPGHLSPPQLRLLDNVANELIQKKGAEVYVANILDKWVDDSLNFIKSEKPDLDFHGGERETAHILSTRPELVKLNTVKPFYSEELGMKVPMKVSDLKDAAPMGYAGDPTVATAETGNRLYEIQVNEVKKIIKKIAKGRD